MSETSQSPNDARSEAQNPWQEVQEGLRSLTMKLDYHLRQASSEQRADAQAALQKVADALDGAVDGIRAASSDPAVRSDLAQLGSALNRAVSSTMSDVGGEIRDFVDRRRRPS